MNHYKNHSKIQLKRIEILYSQGVPAQASVLISALLFWFITRHYVSSPWLLTWLICSLSFNVIRMAFVTWFNANYIKKKKSFDPRQ